MKNECLSLITALINMFHISYFFGFGPEPLGFPHRFNYPFYLATLENDLPGNATSHHTTSHIMTENCRYIIPITHVTSHDSSHHTTLSTSHHESRRWIAGKDCRSARAHTGRPTPATSRRSSPPRKLGRHGATTPRT